MKFRFYINHELHFEGKLESLRCQGTCKTGERCKRHVVIGSPFCFTHLQSEKHLKIKASPIAGKGLFAFSKIPDEALFRAGDTIIKYYGELINSRTLERRYDDHTAPYAIELKKDEYEDGALKRGVGSLANQGRANARLSAVLNVKPNYCTLKATKTIRNGQEILVNYGDSYIIGEHGTNYTTK